MGVANNRLQNLRRQGEYSHILRLVVKPAMLYVTANTKFGNKRKKVQVQVETPERLNLWLRRTRRSLPMSAACFISIALFMWLFGQSLHIPDIAKSTLVGMALTWLMGESIISLYVRYRSRTNRKTAR